MNEYQMAIVVSVCVALVWVVALLCSWAIQRGWAWVDDKKTPYEGNWLWDKMYIGKWKYKCKNDGNYYTHSLEFVDTPYHDVCTGDGSRFKRGRDGGVVALVAGIALIPMLSVLAVQFYPVTLTVITTLGIAHLARFARRNKKLFDAHAKDKDAHKNLKDNE